MRVLTMIACAFCCCCSGPSAAAHNQVAKEANAKGESLETWSPELIDKLRGVLILSIERRTPSV